MKSVKKIIQPSKKIRTELPRQAKEVLVLAVGRQIWDGRKRRLSEKGANCRRSSS